MTKPLPRLHLKRQAVSASSVRAAQLAAQTENDYEAIVHGDDNTRKSVKSIGAGFKVDKIEDELGLVFGFAYICKLNGEDHFDTHGDCITEDCMLKSSLDFMLGGRVAWDYHNAKYGKIGTVAFGYPLSTSIAKSHGIECDRSGFLIGMKIDDAAVLKAFKEGKRNDFSIGITIYDEDVVE